MDEQEMRRRLGVVAAYRASRMKAARWAAANDVSLPLLANWCTHATRWQARLDGAPKLRQDTPTGFVAAKLPQPVLGACVQVQVKTTDLSLSLHWPLSHTRELAAWMREVAR